MSKFIEVISHEYPNDQRCAINTESIMYVTESNKGNTKVYFNDEDWLILEESYDHFLNRLAEVTEVTEL